MSEERAINRALLVYGPESTGTRLLTRILIAAGCYGDGTHGQRLDTHIPDDEPYIAWRRSFPHARRWPDIERMANRLREKDYHIITYVTMRDWYPAAMSQMRRGYASDVKQSLANMQNAYALIFSKLNKLNIPCIVFSYDALVSHPDQYLKKSLSMVGLEPPKDFEPIRDGNIKYYG